MMDFLISNKGKRQVILDGYLYNKQKALANNTISWECVERRNAKLCSARIKTRDGQLVGCVNDDPHPPRPETIRAAQVRGEMKHKAGTTLEKTQDII